MNPSDREYFDVDRKTGRPFSAGHPDGVWILGIVFSLIAVFAAFRALLGAKGGAPAAAIMVSVAAAALYAVAIILLFSRRKIAADYVTVLALLNLLGGMFAAAYLKAADGLNFASIAGLVVGLLLNIYVVVYVHGLRRDGLLT